MHLEIPPSFTALYVPPHKTKPTIPWPEVAQRYELCEDLAQMLTQTAGPLLLEHKVCESDVLERCKAGLLVDGSPVNPAEAQWVVCRLAELMGWEMPSVV